MTTGARTEADRVRRAGYALSAAAVVSIIFILAPSTDAVRFVKISPAVAVVLLVIALLGALGARTGQAALSLAAGVLALLAALLQLVQFGQSTNWLAGSGSTAALLAGLGVGFGALWYAARPSRNSDRGADSATAISSDRNP